MNLFNKKEEELIGAMIGLAKACYVHEKQETTDALLMDCLVQLADQKEAETDNISMYIVKIREEKSKVAPDCATCFNPCGNTDDYDLDGIWKAEPEIRDVKTKIIYALFDYAKMIKLENILGNSSSNRESVMNLLYRGISVLSYDIPVERLQATLDHLRNY